MKNIELNFQRLCKDDYSIEKVFREKSYDWPGDWEGRALLAFCCHYEINGSESPCLHSMVKALSEKTNEKLYFGRVFDGETVDEQQLSGHNWYLRGLLKYARLFDSAFAMQVAKNVVEGLYLPMADAYGRYPLERDWSDGGVSGSSLESVNGWRLSTDVGCAFMCVDGMAHYYEQTRDERVRSFLDKAISLFASVDLLKYRFQTHTTLTCLRGILTLYQATGEEKYLRLVKDKFAFYQEKGMTLTYENFNWFGREDTWTEPCAVVDSLILATELYKITKDDDYKTLARRIWFNGLQFCQRHNGGAGPNTCVTKDRPVLKISMYEASFCCSMRYAEGLLEYSNNKELFEWNENAPLDIDVYGRRFVDDKLLVEYCGALVPIFSCTGYRKSDAKGVELRVIR